MKLSNPLAVTVVSLALSVMFALLLAAPRNLASQQDIQPPAPPSEATSPSHVVMPAAGPPPLPSRQDVADSLSRPLFSPSRRPKPVEPPPAQVIPPPPLTLVGTMSTPDGVVAMARQPGVAASLRLKLGQSVAGWEVAEIGPGRLLLRSGQSEHEFKTQTQPSSGRALIKIGVPSAPPQQ